MASISITYSETAVAYELPAEVGSVLTIGSAEDCSIILPAETGVSEHHCSITRMKDGYAIADLGSANGTFANGNKVENEYLAAGSSYQLGSAMLTFTPDAVAEEGAETAPTATKTRKVVRKAAPAASDRVRAAAAAAAYNRKQQQINYFYVALVLIGAFYAGMAFYSWQNTGNPLPIFLR